MKQKQELIALEYYQILLTYKKSFIIMLVVVSNEYVVVTFNHFSCRFKNGKWRKFKRKEGEEKFNSNSNTSTNSSGMLPMPS